MKRYRRPYDTYSLWLSKGRKRYVEVFKNLGFWDICECSDDTKQIPQRKRPDSGNPGLTECAKCGHLVWPLTAVYECDECMEPTLSDKYPVSEDEPFLCRDCSL